MLRLQQPSRTVQILQLRWLSRTVQTLWLRQPSQTIQTLQPRKTSRTVQKLFQKPQEEGPSHFLRVPPPLHASTIPPCIYMKKSAWSFFLCIHMLKVIKSWRQLTSYPGPPSFLSLAVSDERLWDQLTSYPGPPTFPLLAVSDGRVRGLGTKLVTKYWKLQQLQSCGKWDIAIA